MPHRLHLSAPQPTLMWQAFSPAVIHTCVVLGAGSIITDLVSYYTLPSSVIGNDKYDSLKAAFMYYTVATKTPLQDLMQDILILASNRYYTSMHAILHALHASLQHLQLKDVFGCLQRCRYLAQSGFVVNVVKEA